jgi:transposase, IS5 family
VGASANGLRRGRLLGHRSAISTRKGGGFYGYKIHVAMCARTELPVAWRVQTACTHESSLADDLLQRVRERVKPETATLDKGYDHHAVYDSCERDGVLPIIPLRQTLAVRRGDHGAPECEHGRWTFWGADARRHATKWRCPSGGCRPRSRWIRADRRHPLVPESRSGGATSTVDARPWREFGRLKNEFGLAPLRVRGLERVALHADLVMLARLASALARGEPCRLPPERRRVTNSGE